MIRRIALMRAEDDSQATAAELAARGFEAAIAPAIEIRELPAAPPAGRFDALVATSPRAIRALRAADRARLAKVPLHVVGERAARAAEKVRFALAGEPAGDAAALAERLARTLPPRARLLYLAGRDRKPTLEAALAAAGLVVQAVELYAAEAREAWSEREAGAVAACDGALHYSRRSAALAVGLAARAGLAERFRALLHVCLSADVAEPLAAAGATRIVVAAAADEAHLLAALERACGSSPKG
ncbi:MAG: uroporphyrinogen-III synthase [Roseiarcus sp.]